LDLGLPLLSFALSCFSSWVANIVWLLSRCFFPRGSADLLYKDYHTDQKFTLTTYAANGAVSFHSSVLVFVISPCYFLASIWHDASRYAFRGGGGV
jgi:hypothetical protein